MATSTVETGMADFGSAGRLPCAVSGDWRIVAYTRGGYCRQKRSPIGWRLLARGELFPVKVLAALVEALAIKE